MVLPVLRYRLYLRFLDRRCIHMVRTCISYLSSLTFSFPPSCWPFRTLCYHFVISCFNLDILWGILPIFWKTLSGVNPIYVLAGRIVWSMLLAGGILLLNRQLSQIKAVFQHPRELGRLALAGVLVCINWGVYIWAVNSGRMLDASLAYYMNPILAIVLGNLLFRERLTGLQWLSVAVTLSGLVITVIRYGQFPWASVIIGGSFALYGAVKKGVRSSGLVSVFFETLILSPFAFAFMLWADRNGSGAICVLEGVRWLLLPMAGVVTTVPLLFFAVGIKRTSMTLTGLLMYINPTIQLLLSVFVYGEAFTATHAILFAFVWGGVVLYLLTGAGKKSPE